MEQAQRRRVGERIRDLRKRRRVTQIELATRLNVTQPTLSDYERGELRIDADMLGIFAEALGVPVRALVEDVDEHEIERHALIERIAAFFREPYEPNTDDGKDNVNDNYRQLVASIAV